MVIRNGNVLNVREFATVESEGGSSNDQPARRYMNRELSWLAFNDRVLSECYNEMHPLLERVRYLSISGSNLDEFYMVRVAGLKAQMTAGITELSQDGLTPIQQLSSVDGCSGELRHKQSKAWEVLRSELEARDVLVAEWCHLCETDHLWLEQYFEKYVFPVLTPLAIDPAHPFPFVPNLGFAMALQLRSKLNEELLRAHVPLPRCFCRFFCAW